MSIYLEKLSNNKTIFWKAEFNSNTVIYSYGQVTGKVQVKEETFLEGKNIGRSNETSPEQQCMQDAVKKARKKIESGYTVVSGQDLIDIFTSKTAQKSNLDIPKPMLAFKMQEHLEKIKPFVFCQPKVDGNRCLLNIKTGKLYSRTRKEIISCPHITHNLMNTNFSSYLYFPENNVEWIDGELYSHELTFNDIQSIVRRTKNIDYEKSTSIFFYMFDFISDLCQEGRMQILNTLEDTTYIKILKSSFIPKEEIDKYHDQYVSEGFEGIMIRMPEHPYEQKRSYSLFKYKKFYDDEFKVVGFKCEKNNPNVLGTVTCLMNDSEKTFEVTPSMTDDEKQNIWDNQDCFLGKFATVVFQERDSKTNIPRFGTLKAFREKNT
ncbi:hypothetical protein M0R19_03250 [Candidatus Pacearchaeota archaeon]|jgi:DNA ligase-1|nr:hypothetical protein [Candidatus Pacearchaeota archaeon]